MFDPSFVNSWLNALESDKYHQQRLGLLKSSEGYCCLGVACEKAELEYDPLEEEFVVLDEGHHSTFMVQLPKFLVDRLGLLSPGGNSRNGLPALADLNDNGLNFKTIAWILRDDLRREHPYYFKPEAAEAYRNHFNRDIVKEWN